MDFTNNWMVKPFKKIFYKNYNNNDNDLETQYDNDLEIQYNKLTESIKSYVVLLYDNILKYRSDYDKLNHILQLQSGFILKELARYLIHCFYSCKNEINCDCNNCCKCCRRYNIFFYCIKYGQLKTLQLLDFYIKNYRISMSLYLADSYNQQEILKYLKDKKYGYNKKNYIHCDDEQKYYIDCNDEQKDYLKSIAVKSFIQHFDHADNM